MPDDTPAVPADVTASLSSLGLTPTPESPPLPADGRETRLLARYAHLRDVPGMVVASDDSAPCEERVSAPDLVVLKRRDAERYIAGPNEVCISITDDAADVAPVSGNFVDVLRVAFWDAWDESQAVTARQHGFAVCGPEHARSVAAFVLRHRSARRIVVHCGAGMSRSPAVALAIADALHLSAPGDYPDYNRLIRPQVYEALTNALTASV